MLHPFGTMVRQERRAHGIFLGQMAEALGLDVATLSDYEVGAQRVPVEVVRSVCAFLCLSAEQSALLLEASTAPLIPRRPPTGTVFVSYRHQPSSPDCPCNECRFVRSED